MSEWNDWNSEWEDSSKAQVEKPPVRPQSRQTHQPKQEAPAQCYDSWENEWDDSSEKKFREEPASQSKQPESPRTVVKKTGPRSSRNSSFPTQPQKVVYATTDGTLQASTEGVKKPGKKSPNVISSLLAYHLDNDQSPSRNANLKNGKMQEVDGQCKNAQRKCFVPKITSKPNALRSLDRSMEVLDEQEPTPHPYQFELDIFEPGAEFLACVVPRHAMQLEETPFEYIDTIERFRTAVQEMSAVSELAVDLEHHSYRTYLGITCLLQISSRLKDYVIDTIRLRDAIHELNPVFTNPQILKVFHGGNMDIQWLQRDFGIYVVNMFDTGQGARALLLPKFSLAYLFQHYLGRTIDKKHQLSDWRIRPLPEDMLLYARMDTHELLFLADCVRNDLIRKDPSLQLINEVYAQSKTLCLQEAHEKEERGEQLLREEQQAALENAARKAEEDNQARREQALRDEELRQAQQAAKEREEREAEEERKKKQHQDIIAADDLLEEQTRWNLQKIGEDRHIQPADGNKMKGFSEVPLTVDGFHRKMSADEPDRYDQKTRSSRRSSILAKEVKSEILDTIEKDLKDEHEALKSPDCHVHPEDSVNDMWPVNSLSTTSTYGDMDEHEALRTQHALEFEIVPPVVPKFVSEWEWRESWDTDITIQADAYLPQLNADVVVEYSGLQTESLKSQTTQGGRRLSETDPSLEFHKPDNFFTHDVRSKNSQTVLKTPEESFMHVRRKSVPTVESTVISLSTELAGSGDPRSSTFIDSTEKLMGSKDSPELSGFPLSPLDSDDDSDGEEAKRISPSDFREDSASYDSRDVSDHIERDGPRQLYMCVASILAKEVESEILDTIEKDLKDEHEALKSPDCHVHPEDSVIDMWPVNSLSTTSTYRDMDEHESLRTQHALEFEIVPPVVPKFVSEWECRESWDTDITIQADAYMPHFLFLKIDQGPSRNANLKNGLESPQRVPSESEPHLCGETSTAVRSGKVPLAAKASHNHQNAKDESDDTTLDFVREEILKMSEVAQQDDRVQQLRQSQDKKREVLAAKKGQQSFGYQKLGCLETIQESTTVNIFGNYPSSIDFKNSEVYSQRIARYRFNFSGYLQMVQNNERYGWQNIETESLEVLRKPEETVSKLDLDNVINGLLEGYLCQRPFDLRQNLATMNSDMPVIIYIRRYGIDDRIRLLRRDPWHKLDYALMRWFTCLREAQGNLPLELTSLRFLCKSAIWAEYDRKLEAGEDYNLQEYLIGLGAPGNVINAVLFSSCRDRVAPFL